MDGWMEALANKVHKQGEHIPQHCYINLYRRASCWLVELHVRASTDSVDHVHVWAQANQPSNLLLLREVTLAVCRNLTTYTMYYTLNFHC